MSHMVLHIAALFNDVIVCQLTSCCSRAILRAVALTKLEDVADDGSNQNVKQVSIDNCNVGAKNSALILRCHRSRAFDQGLSIQTRSTRQTPVATMSWTSATSAGRGRTAPLTILVTPQRRYQRVLAQNLAVLAFQKKGTIPASSVMLDGKKFTLPSGEKAMMWNPPSSGTLRLTFESLRMPPKLDACFPNAEIQFTLFALSKSVMASQRRALIELVTSSDK